jgi:hypothetical protein
LQKGLGSWSCFHLVLQTLKASLGGGAGGGAL